MKKLILLFTIISTCAIYSQEIKFGKISKQELEEKIHPIDSTANAAYLYKYRKTHYQYNQVSGFSLVTEIHNRIKIYNKEELDQGNINIYLFKSRTDKDKANNIKGYTFNIVNGKIVKTKLKSEHRFKEKLSDNYEIIKIAFPDVKEGTIIDLKYTINSPFISNIEEVQFQYDIPVNQFSATIDAPEYFKFKKASKGFFSIPIKSVSKNGRISFGSSNNSIDYTRYIDHYNAINIPALADNEPFTSNINNYRGGVKYELSYTQFPNSRPRYYATTWEDVSKKVYKYSSFGDEIKKTSHYKDDLPTLIANAKNSLEKTTKIFQFVKSKIKWNGKYGIYTQEGVKKAYKNGSGNVADINLTLTSMLKEAGLNANPVLVSSVSHGIPLFPTLDGFNYVISMVEFDNGEHVLLDATERYTKVNSLPVRALNWNGRKITKEGYSTWVSLSPKKLSLEEYTIKAAIDDEGTLSGFVRKKEKNLNALLTRDGLTDLKEDKIISNLEEKHKIEIETYKITNQEILEKPISQTFKFYSDNLVEEINNKLYINPLLFLTFESNPFKSENREFPIDFIAPWKENNRISINIPEGYEVESIPEQLAIGISENLGFFKFKVVKTQKGVQINSILQFNSSIIPPNYYKEIKEFYTKVVAKQNERIVLSKIQ